MPYRRTPVAIYLGYLGLLVFVAMAGCNRGNNGTPSTAAAIDGSAKESPSKDLNGGPSLQQSTSDPRHPVVVIETTLGNITVRLDAEKAQLTVGNFLNYTGASFYNQTIVHQVYKGQGILAGGYDANLVEKRARAPIRNEARNGLKNRRGSIAMVRQPDAIDSAKSQFFINVADNPQLDYKDDRTAAGYGYCVFGEVTDGMDVVDKINHVALHDTPNLDRTPAEPIIVTSIRQIR